MKAYCINLDRRPDRRDHMWSEFERLGVEVERFPAVDGSLPEFSETTAALKPGVSGLRLGAGAYACFQSHRLCWQNLVKSGASYAMVLEDDLVIADGFAEYLADGWVPTDADIVRLETRAVRVHLDRQMIPLGRGRYLGRLRSAHYGTACYVISRPAADRLFRLTETISDAIDEVLFDGCNDVFNKLAIYQMVPSPVIQGDRLMDGNAGGDWSRTSIDLRFGQGETASPDQVSLPRQIVGRISAEVRALLTGRRYTFIPHG